MKEQSGKMKISVQNWLKTLVVEIYAESLEKVFSTISSLERHGDYVEK